MDELNKPAPGGSVVQATGQPQPSAEYPVNVDAELQPDFARFLPLIKWLLLVPHYIALLFLGIGTAAVAFIAFFATVVTGRYPRWMWDYMLGFSRWALRVTAYLMLMTDRYPPFTLAETEEDNIVLHAVYPERVERWRPFLAWLLITPYAIVAWLIFLVAQICSLLAFFTIIFTKKIPGEIYDVMHAGLIWQMRAFRYSYWLSTEYPPFSWDDEEL